jgi:signal peptidase I
VIKDSPIVTYLRATSWLRDVAGLVLFVAAVFLGTVFINSFVFQSFSVEGPSMQKTLFTGDRLIVSRVPVTIDQVQGRAYVPDRGQVIVFKNPLFAQGTGDEYIVKRVIAFAGERVVLKDGHYTVYNSDHPNGFNPDDTNHGEPGSPTVGAVDEVVPSGSIFVSGDHRQADEHGTPYSLDSRNGLGTIPLYEIIGPAFARIFPLQGLRLF